MKNEILVGVYIYVIVMFAPLVGEGALLPSEEDISVRVFVDEIKWVKKGVVVFYRIDAPFTPHGRVSYYVPGGQRWGWQLSGSLTAVSKVIQTEGPRIDVSFMESELASFLVIALGQRSTNILDADRAKACNQSKTLSNEAKRKMDAICRDPVASIDGDSWSLSFPVVNADSSASIWKFEGSVDVFSIRAWNITTIEQEGSIPKDIGIY